MDLDLDLERLLTPENRIAIGNDSHVFRNGNIIVKVYQTNTMNAVTRYVSLLNRSAPLLKRIDYRFSVNIFDESYDVSFIGVPILGTVISPAGKPITISKFIPEPNLDKLTAPTQLFSAYEPRDPDPAKQQFFANLNEYFNREQPTRLRDEFDFHTCMLSRLLDFNLGTFGLYLGKYNVKVRPDLIRRSITLIVTDLAVYLPRVVSGASYASVMQTVSPGFEIAVDSAIDPLASC